MTRMAVITKSYALCAALNRSLKSSDSRSAYHTTILSPLISSGNPQATT
jgi:hypothetical protein